MMNENQELTEVYEELPGKNQDPTVENIRQVLKKELSREIIRQDRDTIGIKTREDKLCYYKIRRGGEKVTRRKGKHAEKTEGRDGTYPYGSGIERDIETHKHGSPNLSAGHVFRAIIEDLKTNNFI